MERYSRILLDAVHARRTAQDYDDAMDKYAYVREDAACPSNNGWRHPTGAPSELFTTPRPR